MNNIIAINEDFSDIAYDTKIPSYVLNGKRRMIVIIFEKRK